MLVGYARVSTTDQTLALQRDALERCGCEKIFTDVAGGARTDRSGLEEALKFVRSGDILVIWRLDRLGRSITHLIQVMLDLQKRGVELRSLQEKIDTTSSSGKLYFHLFCALAEFERDLIRERTTAGLAAARARGRRGGRPKALDPNALAIAKTLWENPEIAVVDICRQLKISRATFYRALKEVAEKSLTTQETEAIETDEGRRVG